LPALFIALFPSWLAALIGIGILSAVMSTADGLVVSSSQIFANDIYRRSIVPRFLPHLTGEQIDRRVLGISRWSTLLVLVLCAFMAWSLANLNIALLVWIGAGGMMAAFAGPLVVGALWRRVTRAGAYAGLVGGMTAFVILHSGVLEPAWFGPFRGVGEWLRMEAPNPYSCAALGELVSVGATWAVSQVTQPLPDTHVRRIFGTR
jgi:sodium/proline symporter